MRTAAESQEMALMDVDIAAPDGADSAEAKAYATSERYGRLRDYFERSVSETLACVNEKNMSVLLSSLSNDRPEELRTVIESVAQELDQSIRESCNSVFERRKVAERLAAFEIAVQEAKEKKLQDKQPVSVARDPTAAVRNARYQLLKRILDQKNSEVGSLENELEIAKQGLETQLKELASLRAQYQARESKVKENIERFL